MGVVTSKLDGTTFVCMFIFISWSKPVSCHKHKSLICYHRNLNVWIFSFLKNLSGLNFKQYWKTNQLLIIYSRTISRVVVSWKLKLSAILSLWPSSEVTYICEILVGHRGRVAENLSFQETTTRLILREYIIKSNWQVNTNL